MKAVVCRAFGLEHANIEEVAAPALAPDSVRISVQAAGVSFANLLVINGLHQNRSEPPFTPGTEVAGTIIECGEHATLFRPGQRVVAGVRTGGYAEQVVASEHNVFALPDGIDFDAAVHFPTIYATAYGALAWRANLQPGETLLVHGAAGGSGLAAVEIGKRLGARIIATAGSSAKLEVARAHGADNLVDYSNGGFRDVVLGLTGGRGADVIFDPVGGQITDESLRCIAPEGRLIPMGFAGGTIPSLPANILLVKNVTVIGIYWGYYMGWARQPTPPAMDTKVREAFSLLFTHKSVI
ncbi:MAG TPA: NADPH:quinone oxidoreductase family protein [Hyphomicrobium sp.]|uniref:NADPH:quinone oxidoreductase family protein n=1 Tax=Hyphomicrobium sp. TaxID=82 RepID=UPI002CBD5A81|nr:NADPH:quinone oxidoreductase family protein [Hyphomicrobium sp.]HRN89920.1 NADPH:quinone oxidoreductase family protein [Hyphomicrobium sp.]